MWWALTNTIIAHAIRAIIPYKPERTGGAAGDGWMVVCLLAYGPRLHGGPAGLGANSPTTEPRGELVASQDLQGCPSIRLCSYQSVPRSVSLSVLSVKLAGLNAYVLR